MAASDNGSSTDKPQPHADLLALVNDQLEFLKSLHRRGSLAPLAASMDLQGAIEGFALTSEMPADSDGTVVEALGLLFEQLRGAARRHEILASAVFYHGCHGPEAEVDRCPAAQTEDEADCLVALLDHHEAGHACACIIRYSMGADGQWQYAPAYYRPVGPLVFDLPPIDDPQPNQEEEDNDGGDDADLEGWHDRWMERVRDEHPDEREIDCYCGSAVAGDAVAQFLLGNCYKQGVGIPKDPEQAAVWFRKSAEQGYARAQYHLGRCLYSGEGVPKDLVEAAQWFRRAAEQGHVNAQGILGLSYEAGEGVPKDLTEAAKWTREYESHDRADRQLHSEHSATRRTWEPGDLAVVNPWLQTAAERGDVEVQYHLASCCASGEGMPKDHAQAAQWFRRAAEQGHPGAQYALAHFYLEGKVLPQDPAEAARWIRLADAQYEGAAPPPASTGSATGSLLREGGIYGNLDEDGTYSVLKILKLEHGAAHVRMYSNQYTTLPVSLDESTLYLAGIDAGPDEKLGIGHAPLSEESVIFAKAVLIQQSTVKDEELEGYRMWLEA